MMRAAWWFIVLSYAVGSPVFAFVEARTGFFSERFGYAPEFLYIVAAAQVLCAIALIAKRAELWSVVILTVLAIGAAYSHFRIGSPLTSIPALLYVAVQAWYGICVYRQ